MRTGDEGRKKESFPSGSDIPVWRETEKEKATWTWHSPPPPPSMFVYYVNICIPFTSSALSVFNKTRRRCRSLGCTSTASLTTLCVCITVTHTCHPSCLPGWITLVTGPSTSAGSTTRLFESTQPGNGPGSWSKMSASHNCTERTRVSASVSFNCALLDFVLLCSSSVEIRRQTSGLCCVKHSWGRGTCLRTFSSKSSRSATWMRSSNGSTSFTSVLKLHVVCVRLSSDCLRRMLLLGLILATCRYLCFPPFTKWGKAQSYIFFAKFCKKMTTKNFNDHKMTTVKNTGPWQGGGSH